MSARDLVTVHFRPVFGEPNEMDEIFKRHGFNFHKLTLHDGFAFIVFTSMDQAQRFIREFDGRTINGYNLRVQLGRGQLDRQRERENFAQRSDERRYDNRRHSSTKTIAIHGYPYDLLTERRIFNDFYSTGFIRQVEVKGGVGYIAFDNEDDANRAYNEKNGMRIDNVRITIENVEDRPMNLPKIGIPLVIQEQKTYERRSDPPTRYNSNPNRNSPSFYI
jgi:RNA recognition motif-containing protein